MNRLTTEELVEEALAAILGYGEPIEDTDLADVKASTFEECRMLTRDRGLCLTFPDGTEFQLTIVQSK